MSNNIIGKRNRMEKDDWEVEHGNKKVEKIYGKEFDNNRLRNSRKLSDTFKSDSNPSCKFII